jgi:hypothetical protein
MEGGERRRENDRERERERGERAEGLECQIGGWQRAGKHNVWQPRVSQMFKKSTHK